MRFIECRNVLAATLLTATLGLSPGAAAQSALSGVYKGNGKPASLTQVTAHQGDAESGKPTVVLVFTARNQGGDPRAAFNALFNKYGDALVVKIFADGKVYSADLVHSALSSPSGSITVFGVLKMQDFKMANGQLSGRLTSGGVDKVRDQTWEVDLAFATRAP